MRRITKLAMVVLVAVGALALAPSADAQSRGEGGQRERPGHGGRPGDRNRPRAAPEFDPAAAGAIATLLAGAGVIAGRRRKR